MDGWMDVWTAKRLKVTGLGEKVNRAASRISRGFRTLLYKRACKVSGGGPSGDGKTKTWEWGIYLFVSDCLCVVVVAMTIYLSIYLVSYPIIFATTGQLSLSFVFATISCILCNGCSVL